MLDPRDPIEGLADSKVLTALRREELAARFAVAALPGASVGRTKPRSMR
jgi:ribonuclease HII